MTPLGASRFENVCRAFAVLGCVWFAFAALWGVGAQPHAGHIGSAGAAIAMQTENAIRWHSIYPLWDWYSATDPYPNGAYCHHPFGPWWITRFFSKAFGHRDFVPNLPAALMSVMTAPLIYKTAKHAWGVVAGTAAVLAFVSLPITIGYSVCQNLEVGTIFGGVLFFYGHVKYTRWGRGRDLALSVLGVALTTAGDWPGYLIVAPLLAFSFLRAYVLPSWMTPPLNRPRYDRWWAMSVAMAVFTLALWVGLFKHVDKLSDWLSSADSRGASAPIPLDQVLKARTTWIDFSFTPLAIAIGKLAFPIALLRLLVRRLDAEAYSLSFLFAAVGHYLAFKQGADIHIFWSHYFGVYYAFAIAQLVVSVQAAAEWIGAHVAATRARTLGYAGAVLALVPATFCVFPDGARSLEIWRASGGKYDEKGALFRSSVDTLFVVKTVLKPRVHAGANLAVHSGVGWGWEHEWALEGRADPAEAPNDAHKLWAARLSALSADQVTSLARKFHLRIYGDTLVIDRDEPFAPLDAYSLHEHEPNLVEWMFTNNVEPAREITKDPDPFLTWEWRTHVGQDAPLPPAPTTLEEERIAHNVAVSQGDDIGAEAHLSKLRAALALDAQSYFQGGDELLGVRVTHGVKPMVESYFLASGPTTAESTFAVRSTIVAKNPLSSIPASPVVCDHAFPPSLSTKLWKPKFLYRFEAPLNHRIGRELYQGTWVGGRARLHGPPAIDLATIN
jgi:hypothetical protein